jgi:GAF domain-containing protein
MRQGLISLLGTWWRSNRGELEACRRELSDALEREAATTRKLNRALDQYSATSRELSEALDREKASSKVLGIISSSPTDLHSVFAAILADATRLCEAFHATLWLAEGDGFRAAARHGALPGGFVRLHPGPAVPFARAARTRQAVHVHDLRREQAYLDGDEIVVRAVDVLGIRTLVAVPMLRADQTIGAITVYREEVRPFTDKQIALVTNFAAQAVIAIENARLLTELRESLEQQTATADVLKVISSSPGELEGVFQAMLANATRLCEAQFGILYRYDGQVFRAEGLYNVAPAFADYLRRDPPRPGPGSTSGLLLETKQPIHVPDIAAEPLNAERAPLRVAAIELGGVRTLLHVPMLKEGRVLGSIAIYRKEVRPFTDKQIALVTNFASQAVIAIENARLLTELRDRTNELSESLEQQTATSEVLGVISSSPGELGPVFQTMLANAARLCEASYGALWLCEDDTFRAAALHGPLPPEFAEQVRRGVSPGHATGLATIARTHQTVRFWTPWLSRRRDSARQKMPSFSCVTAKCTGSRHAMAFRPTGLQGRGRARPADRPRRRAAALPGPAQPRWQRHQVYRQGRGGNPSLYDEWGVHGVGLRYRTRYCRRRSGQDLRGVSTGR